MTEVGVDEIVPWAASRCVTVWRGERGAKARDKWVATAREAAKQARRSWLPVSRTAAVSTAALADRGADGVLVLHEEADDAAVERRAARPARSCWSSARRAASPTRRSTRSPRPARCRCGWARMSCVRRRPASPPWPSSRPASGAGNEQDSRGWSTAEVTLVSRRCDAGQPLVSSLVSPLECLRLCWHQCVQRRRRGDAGDVGGPTALLASVRAET